MVRPQIEAMFGASGHSTLLPAVANLEDSLIKCTNISVLREIIDSNRFVIILFGEKNCTPSKQITPEFESLIRGRSKLPEKLVGVYVETSIARDICQSYNVSATPTFLLYLDGQRYLEFFGGDTSKLKISVENLLDASAPMNKHHNNNFNRLIGMINSEPKSFTSSLNHEIALEKLNSALGSANLVPLLGNYKEASLPPKTGQKLVELLKLADRDKILPLLELARELTLNPRIRTEIIQNRGDLDEFLNQFIHQFRSSDREVLVELMHFVRPIK